MPSRILIYEIMEQHSIFKARKVEVKMILKECHIELCIVEHYCFIIKEFLQKLLSSIVKTISINVSAPLTIIRKANTEHIPIPRIQASCFRIKSNVCTFVINSCLNECICFLRILNAKSYTFVNNNIFYFSRNVCVYTFDTFFPSLSGFWFKC